MYTIHLKTYIIAFEISELNLTNMFFKLKYGDNEELLFNSDCCTKALIENIKKRCKLPSNQLIDLADEQANIKGLSEQPGMKFASLLLQQRSSYILLQVNVSIDEKTGDVQKTYTALLHGLNETNPEFLARLANRRPNSERDALSKPTMRHGRKRRGQGKSSLLITSD